jgi:hypothetical protein
MKIPSSSSPNETRRGAVIDHATALYCIVDDLLKAVGHRDDCRRVMSDAEVLTTALMAAPNGKYVCPTGSAEKPPVGQSP